VAVEVFAIPGFGVTGVLGIVAIITALTFGMVDKIVFNFGPTEDGIKEVLIAFAIVLFSMVSAFILSIWGSKKLFSPNRLFGSLALETVQNTDEGYVSFDTATQKSLIGRTAIAHTVLRPSGKVIIDGRVFDAKSEEGFIDRGSSVKIMRDEAGQLYVIKE